MYKLKKTILMLALATLGFYACKQESLKPEGLQMSENLQSSSSMYRINGTNNLIDESQLSTLGDEINVFPDLNGQRMVFTSNANLRTWANTQNQSIRNYINNKLDSIVLL